MKPPSLSCIYLPRAGFTLIENLIALGILLLLFSGLFVLSGQCIRILRVSFEHAATSQVLQQRNEQVRVAGWQQINNPDWVKANILNQNTDGEDLLADAHEFVSIAPYSTGSNSIVSPGLDTFERVGGTVTSSGVALSTSNSAVQVTWTLTWTESASKRSLSRSMSTILANGGTPKPL
ncbi:MAG: prepilin-type N-terminal cleavage/methylation domain-containing protein [Verrucomicrobiota bacterium]